MNQVDYWLALHQQAPKHKRFHIFIDSSLKVSRSVDMGDGVTINYDEDFKIVSVEIERGESR